MTTFGAGIFPLLVTVKVKVNVSPGTTRVLSTDLATTGSATDITGVLLGTMLPGVGLFVGVLVLVGITV